MENPSNIELSAVARALHRSKGQAPAAPVQMELCSVMLLAIGPALGALSSVGAMLESAASNLGSAVDNQLSTLGQSLSAATGQTPQLSSTTTPSSPFNTGTMAALISLQGQAGSSNGASGLFAKLDANGDGSISKSEFESALGSAGVDTSSADALFTKLDANGDGSISKAELTPKRGGYHHRGYHHVGGGSGGGGASSLMDATNAAGSKTQTTTNSDGSSTTTITYADGSTVSMIMPAAQSGSAGTQNGGTGTQSNLIERLIQMQSALISTQASATAMHA
jgi:hypothetical protein